MKDSAGEHQYDILTWGEHLVSEYTGLNFLEIGELPLDQYLLWRRDAFIYNCNQTEAGQEYLKNAYRMEQTKPDRVALRKKYGKEG